MENMALVRDILGVAELGALKNEMDFIPIIRKGFKSSVLGSLRKRTSLSESVFLGSLGIAKRTAARRKHQSDRLKPVESELVLRFARVLAAATEILGSEEKANQWMLQPNRSIGNLAPIKAIDTGIGFHQVMATLRRIEFGVYS